ncbi:hypothetical protein [Evansella tamaricis]|uniref:Uncharacterized protein n=1 Tax=Evansella tamaricis TaxID=2069301 RepID=A0ABS6JDE2_9BACI|nr:hypothetical protein [Evansella tamaricis]MBU9710872.1 hypothetical protein [Evansella tamaricis]
MYYNNTSTGMPGIVPVFLLPGVSEGDGRDVKLNEDSYDLYVNDDYIGKHSFLVQKEDASAITDFLNLQGFSHVNIEVTGDHIVVHPTDEEESDRMEKALKVFLKNR